MKTATWNTKNIYLIVGESGSGKSTIAEELQKRYGLTYIQSYTTRPKRNPNEKGHIFVNDEEFDELKDLVAYTEFDGYRYCATKEQIDNSSLYIVDLYGIEYFKEHYKGNKIAYVIYIYSDLKDRALRMQARGDTNEQILQRIKNDYRMFQNIRDIADIIIYNLNDLDTCINKCYEYICEKENV